MIINKDNKSLIICTIRGMGWTPHITMYYCKAFGRFDILGNDVVDILQTH